MIGNPLTHDICIRLPAFGNRSNPTPYKIAGGPDADLAVSRARGKGHLLFASGTVSDSLILLHWELLPAKTGGVLQCQLSHTCSSLNKQLIFSRQDHFTSPHLHHCRYDAVDSRRQVRHRLPSQGVYEGPVGDKVEIPCMSDARNSARKKSKNSYFSLNSAQNPSTHSMMDVWRISSLYSRSS